MAKEVLVGVVQKDNQYLLIKRADHNKYDPNRWEFVSLSRFDKNRNLKPQIRNQILAETGLRALFDKSSGSFEVEDEYGRWTVRPFLFKTPGEKVQLDKDHTEYKWIKPNELVNYECVKDLDKNLTALAVY